MQIPVAEVLVGDRVEISTGDILSADGVFISGASIKCDESGATGESDAVKKGTGHKEDPFFLSGTMVLEGSGAMLVTATGVHSFNGKLLMALRVENEGTPLQIKLEALAESIAYFGIVMAAVTFSSLIGKHLFISHLNGEELFDEHFFSAIVKYTITAITMLVVAVPEGLPLAVTMALAYSTMKMLEDNNLVRHIDACETMGGATNICSDKTGTLTENRMTVVKGAIAGNAFESVTPAVGSQMAAPVRDLLFQGIAVNSNAYETTREDGTKAFIGSKTECALLQFSSKLGSDFVGVRKSSNVARVYPFSSRLKSMSTVVAVDSKKHRIYVKGASEIIVGRCDRILNASGTAVPLTAAHGVSAKIDELAQEALRTIGLAYADLDSFVPVDGDDEGPQVKLVLIGIVGIEDPVREAVPKAVKDCQQAGITVRMVTGDNIITARSIAKKCGILTEGGLCMEGPEFRKLTGSELTRVATSLQVLARSSPMDKQVLVDTLKKAGQVVAVTGDGTNDGPALKLANVGFSMGIAGTEVAKEASDIVLMDDNFASIVKAVSWGRNVYDSIRRFLQFQMTVNVAAVALAFIGSITSEHGESPLKPVQLLWVNLIMDTMAALALATDSPTPDMLKRKPYAKNESLITPLMWRNILGQALFQMVVNLSILYFGDKIFGVELHSVKHLTFFFNIFVFCQVFNEINARKIYGELNIFAGLFSNRLFMSVIVFTVVMQFLFVEFGGSFVGTTSLSLREWLVCIGVGALSMPVALLLHYVPVPGAKPAAPVAAATTTPTAPAATVHAPKPAANWAKLAAATNHSRSPSPKLVDVARQVRTTNSILTFIRRRRSHHQFALKDEK
ncbi:calcium-translocating P-type ATPase [Capsaspora owczarzaki ATCC 30864]|uniref:Calcium-transporting ATPase n=2 Tax=Capsaspora owczarzaki (strain ATCC 30864) TaxID=595528 RepID=A0A0D2WJX7_CAPO3|nr:calcium-translocating P-type ATPase [Capsaspora owczarzaki ATCC 30864]